LNFGELIAKTVDSVLSEVWQTSDPRRPHLYVSHRQITKTIANDLFIDTLPTASITEDHEDASEEITEAESQFLDSEKVNLHFMQTGQSHQIPDWTLPHR